MTNVDHPTPESETPSDGNRPRSGRLPLVGAIAFAVVAGAVLVDQIVELARPETPPVVKRAAADAAPVPLSAQAFSFLGKPAAVPDLRFVDADGKEVSLLGFKGRPLLLNIWATWCLPCRKEMPSLDRLQAQFEPRKFLVLTLSIDRGGLPAVRKFYADLGLKSLGVYFDKTGDALRKLGLLGIPATLLINADGQEIGRKLGPAEWDSPETMAVLRQRVSLDAAKPAPGASP